ncbi:MAG: hypothetical protein LBB50_02220 [Oscillospiraceae bacterium]|jgi:hypothetical protein|nr:hypothetical protein [Oscillospiraceae bacterium]
MNHTRNNWTKKTTILLAAVCMALVSVCGMQVPKDAGWLLQVEGVPVSRGLYSYFVAQALQDAAVNRQGRPQDLKALRADTARRCAEYVAVTSELHNQGQRFDELVKLELSQKIVGYWRMYGNYYTSIGVDKPTLGLALRGEAARKQLFRVLYGEGGVLETPQSSIESYFYGNFVAYEGVRVFLNVPQEDGTSLPMTDKEVSSARGKLAQMVEEANAAPELNFVELAQKDVYKETLSYMIPSSTEVKKGQPDIPDKLFEELRGLDRNKLTLLEQPGFFIVARGINMRKAATEYFDRYRETCLWELKQHDFDVTVAALTKEYRTDENAVAINELLAAWPF